MLRGAFLVTLHVGRDEVGDISSCYLLETVRFDIGRGVAGRALLSLLADLGVFGVRSGHMGPKASRR